MLRDGMVAGEEEGLGTFALACGPGCLCLCLIMGVVDGEVAEGAGVLRLSRCVVVLVLL